LRGSVPSATAAVADADGRSGSSRCGSRCGSGTRRKYGSRLSRPTPASAHRRASGNVQITEVDAFTVWSRFQLKFVSPVRADRRGGTSPPAGVSQTASHDSRIVPQSPSGGKRVTAAAPSG
jgi:hypothetical protein